MGAKGTFCISAREIGFLSDFDSAVAEDLEGEGWPRGEEGGLAAFCGEVLAGLAETAGFEGVGEALGGPFAVGLLKGVFALAGL